MPTPPTPTRTPAAIRCSKSRFACTSCKTRFATRSNAAPGLKPEPHMEPRLEPHLGPKPRRRPMRQQSAGRDPGRAAPDWPHETGIGECDAEHRTVLGFRDGA